MASSKVMASSKPRNSDLSTAPSRSRRSSSTTTKLQPQQQQQQLWPSPTLPSDHQAKNDAVSTMTVDGILRNVVYSTPSTESTLLDAQITLIDPPDPLPPGSGDAGRGSKTVDEVWREIVAGRKDMKEEPGEDEMMTLEDFLVKAGAVEEGQTVAEVEEEDEIKMPPPLLVPERLSGGVYAFDSPFQVLDKMEGSIVGFGNGTEVVGAGCGGGSGGGRRGKRGRGAALMEPLDKAAQQRQRRMIKNRESAARSRERKQAYQVELESLAVKLEEENELLIKEKEERTKERLKQLMEKIVPVGEKRRPARALRRVRSFEW